MLEDLMRKAGLRGLATEWWHFQLPEAFHQPEKFKILNGF
jgi:D-alanyl-D-alanine dipeptidase